MSLVSAINIASSRQTSKANADEYLALYTQYIRGLKELFPTYKCHPNHHFAFHIAEYLSLYGPVHGWWTYAMERVIGKLQRISTNYIPGEYEKTISTTWHRRNGLHAFLDSDNPTKTVMRTIFNRLVIAPNRGAVATDLGEDVNRYSTTTHTASKRAVYIDAQSDISTFREYSETIPMRPMIDTFSSVTLKGLIFSTRTQHRGNSQVVISDVGDGSFCAEIDSILRVVDQPVDDVWVRVRRFDPPNTSTDPYSAWPLVKARLISRHTESKSMLIHSSRILAHFASCNIEWEDQPVSVAISLTRELLVPSGIGPDEEEEIDGHLDFAFT